MENFDPDKHEAIFTSILLVIMLLSLIAGAIGGIAFVTQDVGSLKLALGFSLYAIVIGPFVALFYGAPLIVVASVYLWVVTNLNKHSLVHFVVSGFVFSAAYSAIFYFLQVEPGLEYFFLPAGPVVGYYAWRWRSFYIRKIPETLNNKN